MSGVLKKAAVVVISNAVPAALLILSLQACIPAPSFRSGVPLPQKTVDQLQAGRTTKAEVLEWFGMPLSIAAKGETLTISRGPEWAAEGGVRHAHYEKVDADTFFELFSTKHAITDRDRIYYYYDTVSSKYAVVLAVYINETANTRSDRLWVLVDEETGLVEDYVFRKASSPEAPAKAPIVAAQAGPSPSASRSEAVSAAPAVTASTAPSTESDQFLKVGDRWKYKFNDRGRDAGSVTVEIVKSSGRKVRERFTREGYKGFVAERDVEVVFSPSRFQAPIALPGGYLLTELAPYLAPGTELKAGQVWDSVPGTFFFANMGKKTMVSQVKVVEQETVRVPAGVFLSWRIETESVDLSGIYPAKAKCTFWYSPESKRTIKMTIESNLLLTSQSGGESYELVSFDPGK